MANIVHVDALLIDWSVSHVIRLLEDRGRQLLLPLPECVNIRGAYIERLGHARRCLPVCSGTHDVSLGLPVVIGPLTVDVAASKDARLQLSVLFVACVVSGFHVATFCR